MITLKKILFPTDFSENSKAAHDYALAFTEQFEAELHVMHVLSDVTMIAEPGSALSLPQNYLLDMKQGRTGARSVVSRCGAKGSQGRASLSDGKPVR